MNKDFEHFPDIFKLGSLGFLESNILSSLYIWDISPLWNVELVKIFSQSADSMLHQIEWLQKNSGDSKDVEEEENSSILGGIANW